MQLAGVVGTAGHVDHGKSSLVQALTGVNPDRLPEERARGMSIELGFAPWLRPKDRKVAIVDVPGHERFIKNMAIGAGGVDVALLVVAADDGLMPQSREHSTIMQLLGVRHAVVALSKIDLAGPELSQLAQDELRAWLKDGPWHAAPIVPCAAPLGVGLEALSAALDAALALALAESKHLATDTLRVPLDRAFLVPGRGVVVAGPLRSGRIQLGDQLRLEPGGLPLRVRALQSLGEALQSAQAPGRVAVVVAGLEGQAGVEIAKGACLVDANAASPTHSLLVQLSLAPESSAWPKRGTLAVMAGASQAQGRLSWWEEAGQCWGALALDRPLVAWVGDRLLLRRSSPDALLGVGHVLHRAPGPWRQAKSWGPALLLAAQGQHQRAADLAMQQAGEKGLPAERLLAFWPANEGAKAEAWLQTHHLLCGAHLHHEAWQRLRQKVLLALGRGLQERPWVDGLSLPQLAACSGLKAHKLEPLLMALAEEGRCLRVGPRWSLPSHQSQVFGPLAQAEARAKAHLAREGHVTFSEAEAMAPPGLSLAWKERLDAWPHMNVAHRSAGLWLDENWVQAQSQSLRQHFGKAAFTTSEAREALGSTRKLTIPLLELLDARQITRRQGDRRCLLSPKSEVPSSGTLPPCPPSP